MCKRIVSYFQTLISLKGNRSIAIYLPYLSNSKQFYSGSLFVLGGEEKSIVPSRPAGILPLLSILYDAGGDWLLMYLSISSLGV